MTQLNLLDLIDQPNRPDDVDHLIDALIAEMTALGLSKADQQALVVRLNAQQVIERVKRWPQPAQTYFLNLVVEGLADS